MPKSEVLDGLFILIAGIILITPGLLTDFMGFLLLVPVTRKILSEWVNKWIRKKISHSTLKFSGTNFFSEKERKKHNPWPINIDADVVEDEKESK